MHDIESKSRQPHVNISASIIALLILNVVMLLALFTGTVPHPPHEVPPFALGPFLGASLALGAAALHLVQRRARYGTALAVFFALVVLLSFGPQKYFDPVFSRIWPAVILGQVAVCIIFYSALVTFKKSSP